MTPELPFPGSYSSTDSPTQRHICPRPSVEATGLPADNKLVITIANLGLTAKIIAGNEKVLGTSSGLRLPHGPAAVDDIKANVHISSSVRRTEDGIPARIIHDFHVYQYMDLLNGSDGPRSSFSELFHIFVHDLSFNYRPWRRFQDHSAEHIHFEALAI